MPRLRSSCVDGEAVGYKASVGVPPNGSITFRICFRDFVGRFVYHCHIFMHEDRGMMGVIEVIPR